MSKTSMNSIEIENPAIDISHSSRIRRVATHPDEIVDNMTVNPMKSCWDLYHQSVKISGSRPLLGWRNSDDSKLDNEFQWLTYAEVERFSLRVGSACLHHNLIDEMYFPEEQYINAQKLRQIGLFSKNRVEWFILEQSANAYGFTLIPLYDALSEEAVVAILKQTKLNTVAGSTSCLKRLIEIVSKHSDLSLKNLIVFDVYPAKSKASIFEELSLENDFEKTKKKFSIYYFSDFLKHQAPLAEIKPGTLQDVCTICYTSGTTGEPKGVILTQQNLIAAVCATVRGPLSFIYGLNVNNNDIHFSYLPLAHVFERIICNIAIFLGASIGIASEDPQRLLEDLSVLKPTIFVSVPRLFHRIHERVLATVDNNYSIITRWIFNFGLANKIHRLKTTSQVKSKFWDYFIFNKIQKQLSSRLRFMLVGSASLDSEIEDDIKAIFCTPLCEGYGLTETFGASFVSLPSRSLSGTIGSPIPCIEYRLEDVPEMNYTSKNNCGELIVRGPSVFPGYFLNKEATNSVLDKDGWFSTGDIAALLPNGDLKILDRKKNVFKLTQGEYVSPERLENVYDRCVYVKQIFVYGDSSRNCLVCIIHPNEDAIYNWINDQETEINKSISDIYNDIKIKKEILKNLEHIAQQTKLKGFEKIKAVYLSKEPFTIDNNLLTPTLKLRRHNVKKYFDEQIKQMYAATLKT